MEVSGFFLILVLAVLYFVPPFVAYKRKHKNALPIFPANLLLGGLYGLGRVVALIWACADNVKRQVKEEMEAAK